jgi:hypothetical protein
MVDVLVTVEDGVGVLVWVDDEVEVLVWVWVPVWDAVCVEV